MINVKRSVATTVAALGIVAAFLFSTAVPASADKDGACNAGDLCLWWGYSFTGSHFDSFWGDGDHRDDVFNSPGGGQWQHLNDNAASAANYDSANFAYVTSLLNCTGSSQFLLGRYGMTNPLWYTNDLGGVANNNWSNCFRA